MSLFTPQSHEAIEWQLESTWDTVATRQVMKTTLMTQHTNSDATRNQMFSVAVINQAIQQQ